MEEEDEERVTSFCDDDDGDDSLGLLGEIEHALGMGLTGTIIPDGHWPASVCCFLFDGTTTNRMRYELMMRCLPLGLMGSCQSKSVPSLYRSVVCWPAEGGGLRKEGCSNLAHFRPYVVADTFG